MHPVSGGLESLRCNLLGLRTRHECLDIVADYCSALPPGGWVLGGGWTMSAFPGGLPTAADLDAVTGGRPAFLPNRDHHSAWVNTAALTLAGIDASTPDPADGRIERDEAGRPTGALHDGAMRLVAAPRAAARPRPSCSPASSRARRTCTRWASPASRTPASARRANSACRTRSTPTCMAADYGMLSSHVVGALWWDRDRGLDQIDDLLARREQASDGQFRATTVKLMLDGVCETFTAAMSSPYLDRHGHPTGHQGRLFIEPEMLREATRRLGAAGFQLHFHAIGDHAVSTALDAIEALPAAQRQAARHHLAHLQFITPRDMGRFAALGAVANFQPLWACADTQMEELTLPFVGPSAPPGSTRSARCVRQGTRIAFGSDWPVSSADPLQEIHVAVNRVLSERLGRRGEPECDRSVPARPGDHRRRRDRRLHLGVAWVNHEEDVAGRLLPGMRADVTVLDQDLFAVPARDIGSTSVVMTVAGGTVVHGDR